MNPKLQLALGFGLLAILAAAAIWSVVVFSSAFMAANPSVQAATIAALAAIASLIVTYLRERAKSVQEAHREKKIEVYSKFYDLMFSTLRAEKEGRQIDNLSEDPKFRDDWYSITRGILFYGSPRVVKAFSRVSREANNGEVASVLSRMGDVLLAMRADIGLSNYGLNSISVHGVYVSDDLSSITGKP
jgi:hypothetical protein